jgi:hypothetical protein
MLVHEPVSSAAVGRVVIAVIVIAGRVALDRIVPRGRFSAHQENGHIRLKPWVRR